MKNGLPDPGAGGRGLRADLSALHDRSRGGGILGRCPDRSGRAGYQALPGGDRISEVKNLPASVRQRLLNKARTTDRPFNEILQYYAIERFLYRVSRSSYSDQFILKGALIFLA